MKKSICFFSSFFVGGKIPYYVEYYLTQCRQHFDEFIYLYNEQILDASSADFLAQNNIQAFPVKNEGYDFGMWYKAFKSIDSQSYHTVALINDSCILFRPMDDVFKAIQNSKAHYIGMLRSDRYAPHIQSFFVIIKDEAVPAAFEYFLQKGIVSDYRQVIQTYEIGLSQHMIQQGFHIEGLYNKGFESFEKNPSFARVKELIEEGMPMIKKKIVFRNYRGLEHYWVVRMNFNADYRIYFDFIKKQYDKSSLIDIERVMRDAPRQHHFDLFLFAIARGCANFLRAIPGMRWLFHQSILLIKKFRK
ncbi:MAG: rhamnan synthesis F family protein [Flavobacteriales bacterium]|jgi:hypothetical protein